MFSTKIVLIFSLILVCKISFSQTYSFDIDKDGIEDQILLSKIDSTNKFYLHYSISSLNDKIFETPEMFKGFDDTKLINFKNDNLIINIQHNRTLNQYTFKYIERNKDFVLIGFDSRSEGNAVNDGSGNSSWNLLNGTYIDIEYSYNSKLKKLVKSKNKTLKIQSSSIYTLSKLNDEILDEISTYLSEKSEVESMTENSDIQPKSNLTTEKKTPIKKRNIEYDRLILELADKTNDFIKEIHYYKRNSPHLVTSTFIKKWQDKLEVYMKKLELADKQGKLNEEQIKAVKDLQYHLMVNMSSY